MAFSSHTSKLRKALEDFSSSDDELVGGTKSNEDLLLQRLGRD